MSVRGICQQSDGKALEAAEGRLLILFAKTAQTELVEAFSWTNNNEALMSERRSLPSGSVTTLFDLLVSNE